jgi:uncharacterized membrane protein
MATTLAVWTFPDVDAARQAEKTLASVAARRGITVDDGAMLTWTLRSRLPRTRGLHSLALDDAVGGDFWAVLFAVVFLFPTLDDRDGGDGTAFGSVLDRVGIPEDFTAELRRVTGPGTSALALLTTDGTRDEASAAFSSLGPRLTSAVLSSANLRTLRRAFAG